jgi:hypothetical protein
MLCSEKLRQSARINVEQKLFHFFSKIFCFSTDARQWWWCTTVPHGYEDKILPVCIFGIVPA